MEGGWNESVLNIKLGLFCNVYSSVVTSPIVRLYVLPDIINENEKKKSENLILIGVLYDTKLNDKLLVNICDTLCSPVIERIPFGNEVFIHFYVCICIYMYLCVHVYIQLNMYI
jgi:hypothetical protein